jgi:hypothetical protein
MNEYKKKYPHIVEFLGFFGQDWKIMFEWENITPNHETAIRKLKIDAEESGTLLATISELKELLSLETDDEFYKRIVLGFGSAFYPHGIGLNYYQWLEKILSILKEPLEITKKHKLPKFVGE